MMLEGDDWWGDIPQVMSFQKYVKDSLQRGKMAPATLKEGFHTRAKCKIRLLESWSF